MPPWSVQALLGSDCSDQDFMCLAIRLHVEHCFLMTDTLGVIHQQVATRMTAPVFLSERLLRELPTLTLLCLWRRAIEYRSSCSLQEAVTVAFLSACMHHTSLVKLLAELHIAIGP